MNEIEFKLIGDFKDLYLQCSIFEGLYPDSEYIEPMISMLLELANTDSQMLDMASMMSSRSRERSEKLYMDVIQRLLGKKHFDKTLADAICGIARFVNRPVGRCLIRNHWKDFSDCSSLSELGDSATLFDLALARQIFEYAENQASHPDEYYRIAASSSRHFKDQAWIESLLHKADRAFRIRHAVELRSCLGDKAGWENILETLDKREILQSLLKNPDL